MVKASRSAVKPRNSQKPGKAPSPPQLVTPSSARATIAQVVQQAEALMGAGQRDAALGEAQAKGLVEEFDAIAALLVRLPLTTAQARRLARLRRARF